MANLPLAFFFDPMFATRCLEHSTEAGLCALMRNGIRCAPRENWLSNLLKSPKLLKFVLGHQPFLQDWVHYGDGTVHLGRALL